MRLIYSTLILLLVLSISGQSEPDANLSIERSTVMLFDASESMKDNDKINSAKIAVKEFISALDPATDELALIVFYDCDNIVVEQPFTADQSALSSKVDTIRPTGKTPLTAAMAFAKSYIEDNANGTDKKIIQLTDGTETCSRRTVSNKTEDLDISIIGFDILNGSEQETELMNYAQSIGADYINAGNASNSSDLINILQREYEKPTRAQNLAPVPSYDEAAGQNLSLASSAASSGNTSDELIEPDEVLEAEDGPEELNLSSASSAASIDNASDDLGGPDEVIGDQDEAAKLNLSDPSYWINMGNALYSQGKYNEAAKAYDEAIKLNSSDPLAWKGKADALYALGQFDEAAKAYDEAIKLSSADPLLWKGKADALYALGLFDEAAKAYDEAIKLNSSDPLAWKGKADALYALGQYDEAAKAYDEAIKLSSADPLLWKGKADALYALGQFDEAAKAYDEAKRLDPNIALSREGKASDALQENDSAVGAIVQPSMEIGKGISSTPSQPGFIGTIYSGANVPKKDKFVCNLMSACGMYPRGLGNNGDGATANLGAFNLGRINRDSS